MPRALIFYGGWDGHQPFECSLLVKSLLEGHGFIVDCYQGTNVLLTKDLQDYDLIIPMITMGEISYQEVQKLIMAIESGVGLAGFHGGMGDSFRQCVEFQFIVGGQWVAHPGDMIDYKVHIEDKQHPITAELNDFDYCSEQYYMHVDPSIHILASTTYSASVLPWIEGVVMPVAWTKKYGLGNVFYCSLGHNAEEFENPNFNHLLIKGMQFVTRQN